MGDILKNEFIIKVKSNNSKQKIENFGGDRYLVRVISTNNTEINKELKEMFSHYWGIPEGRISISSGIDENNKIIRIER